MLREATHYARLALSFGRLSFTRPETDPAAMVQRYLQNRQANFLTLMRKAVFDRPANPYKTMFHWPDASTAMSNRWSARMGSSMH